VLAVVLLPVPWMHVVDVDPPGQAWRLDGRLIVDGERVEPSGRWSWLTVGRPPVLAEVVRDSIRGGPEHARDMRQAPASSRPALNEPAAAAVGLLHAGAPIEMRVVVEALGAQRADLPDRALVERLNGVRLTDRAAWRRARARSPRDVVFTTRDGETFVTPGPLLPYERVHVVDVAPSEVDAAVVGQLGRIAPVRWFRSLALGRSHGLMVALMTYADASGEDLAAGRHIAGTGGVNGEGTVTQISGLRSKARAAKRAGADVLVYPAVQHDELADFDPGSMELHPVLTLTEAIEGLGH
jgi:Lon-like protease